MYTRDRQRYRLEQDANKTPHPHALQTYTAQTYTPNTSMHTKQEKCTAVPVSGCGGHTSLGLSGGCTRRASRSSHSHVLISSLYRYSTLTALSMGKKRGGGRALYQRPANPPSFPKQQYCSFTSCSIQPTQL